MAKGFITGITTGALIGAAVSMMMMPELDRNTKKRIRKIDRMIMNAADGAFNSMRRMGR